ncbi:MAG: MFS transporter [Lachnospirales bacterium]
MGKVKNMNVLIFGQLFAVLGSKFLDLAIGLFYMENAFTSTNVNLGFFNVLLILPSLFFVIPLGNLTNILNKKNILIFDNIAMLLISFVLFYLIYTSKLNILIGMGLVMAFRTIAAHFRMALDFVVSESALDFKDVKNSNILNGICITISPLIGGVVYIVFGYLWVIVCCIVLFIFATVFALFIKQGEVAKNFDADFKIEKTRNYIKYEASPRLDKMVKLSFLVNMFFATTFMTTLPVIIYNIGISGSIMSGSVAILLCGAVFIIYSNVTKKRKISLDFIITLMFICTAIIGVVSGLMYYSLLPHLISEILVYFNMAIVGVCFTITNVYTYLEFRKLVNAQRQKDFAVLHLFYIIVAIILGNLLLGIFFTVFKVGVVVFSFCSIAIAVIHTIGKFSSEE